MIHELFSLQYTWNLISNTMNRNRTFQLTIDIRFQVIAVHCSYNNTNLYEKLQYYLDTFHTNSIELPKILRMFLITHECALFILQSLVE